MEPIPPEEANSNRPLPYTGVIEGLLPEPETTCQLTEPITCLKINSEGVVLKSTS